MKCKGVKKTVPKPVVYNVHLAEVEDGAKLEPLNIPFIFKENYDEILILSDVGCDSILCWLKQDDKDTLSILKLEFD